MEGEAIEKKKQLDVKQAEITIKKVRFIFFANKNSNFYSIRVKLILN